MIRVVRKQQSGIKKNDNRMTAVPGDHNVLEFHIN
jgi:hypothetical protein